MSSNKSSKAEREEKPVSEYGEPWKHDDDEMVIFDRDGDQVVDTMTSDFAPHLADRAVACVNSMAGIPNPEAVRELVEACRALRAQYEQRGTFSENGFKIIEIVRALDKSPRPQQQ